jgi:hypothetical protein
VQAGPEKKDVMKSIHGAIFCLRIALALAILIVAARPNLNAQQSGEFDDYKIRFDADWFYSKPMGHIRAQGDSVPVDFHTDLNFGSYSTFAGKVDWKFTHKNHFYVVIIPLWTFKTATLSRDIVWNENPFTPVR